MRNSKSTKFLVISTLVFILSIAGAKAATSENLIGIKLDYEKNEITIQVVSSGCTDKTSFAFEVKNDMLTINRIKQDECKAIEEAVSLTYTMKELGIDPNVPFILTNKLICNPYLARVK